MKDDNDSVNALVFTLTPLIYQLIRKYKAVQTLSLLDIQNYGEIKSVVFSSIIGSYPKYRQNEGQGQSCWLSGVLAELRAAEKWMYENDHESKTGLTWILG